MPYYPYQSAPWMFTRTQTNMVPASNNTPGGAVITDAGSTSTKGSSVVLINSTSFDAFLIEIMAFGMGGAGLQSEACLDILTGAGVIIPNLLAGYSGDFAGADSGPKVWQFPLFIPAGTQLLARIAGTQLGRTSRVVVWIYGGDGQPPYRVGNRVTTYGIGTVPNGASLTPGTNGVAGNWAEITAATSEDHFCVVPSWQLSADTAILSRMYYLDVGLGAAAAEASIGGPYAYNADANEKMDGPTQITPIYRNIPAGSRLSARMTCPSASLNLGYQAALHCVS